MVRNPVWLVALNVLFGILFLISAGLQYNDPDPIRWAAIYTGAAVTTVLALHTRRGWLATGGVCLIATVWAALLWSSVIGHVMFSDFWLKMSEKGGKVEEMREAGGLTIVSVWLSVTMAIGMRRARRR